LWFTKTCGERSPHFTKKAGKCKEKAKKEFKKAMIATWSNSDSSDSDDEEEATNLYFMVNEDQVQEDETDYESSDEVNCSNFLEYSKDELAEALIKCIRCEQEYLSKIKSLKKHFVIHPLKKKFYKYQTTNLTQGLRL